MTELQVILYSVFLTSVGAVIMFLAYLGCAKLADWREENDRAKV